jgi:aminoglycoside phosphotransferase family enzyme/predicted kinase
MDQQDVFAFLGKPETYGRTDPVIRIDTHGAAVFLAGPDVYKVKRAVRFPFMDFSTLDKRHAACVAEIAVNTANAPDLYVGVVPITRDGNALRLGGEGKVIEWAVHLKRFDENATLDRLVSCPPRPLPLAGDRQATETTRSAKAPLGDGLIDRLARAVLAAHRRAPLRDAAAATRALRCQLLETIDELAGFSELFPPERTASLGAALQAGFDHVENLLLRRGAQGQVRRCHGDLHLGNIVLIRGEPVLFDAIEFDEAIATSDILYDLAFLLMDLCERGRRAEANRLLNRYFSFCDDMKLQVDGLAALPLFLGLRAAIRAKVTAAALRLDPRKPGLGDTARAYFAAAIGFIAPVPPLLLAVGGLSGSGKSTLAAAIASALGRAPGAVHLRSDIQRKRMFGVAETARLPEAAYLPEVSAKVFDGINDLAESALRAGQAVIVDATHQRPEDRAATAAVAARAGAGFLGLWLQAPLELLMRRVTDRRADASDATASVVARQAGQAIGALDWHILDSSQSLEALREKALSLVRRGTNGGEITPDAPGGDACARTTASLPPARPLHRE